MPPPHAAVTGKLSSNRRHLRNGAGCLYIYVCIYITSRRPIQVRFFEPHASAATSEGGSAAALFTGIMCTAPACLQPAKISDVPFSVPRYFADGSGTVE